MFSPSARLLRRPTVLVLLLALLLSIVPFGHDRDAAASQMFELASAPQLDAQRRPVAAASSEMVAAAAGSTWVDTLSRASVVSFYGSSYASTSPAARWTGDVDDCRAGSTSTAMKTAVLNQINYYRSMAGVPKASGMSSATSTKNQQAALIFSANDHLSHHPSSDSSCYTDAGAEAARSSNICLGCYGVEAVNGGYMLDPGEGNASVGHRRWLLYPQTRSFGTGDIPGDYEAGLLPSNAVWVMDDHIFDPRPATRDGFVAWPPSGYVPYQVVFPRWSFSLPGADFQNATVSLRRGSSAVSVVIDSRSRANEGYAEDTIVWRPNDMDDRASWAKPAADTRYSVTVANVLVGGKARSYSYAVTVIDPATAGTPTCTNSPSSGIVRTSVAITCAGFAPGEAVTVHWDTTASAAMAAHSADANGTVRVGYRVPNTPSERHTVAVAGQKSGLIGKKTFIVKPSIGLSPSSGASGSTIKIALRGFAAGEAVSVRF